MNTIADIRQAVIDILEVLPSAKQQELLNFAEFLHSKNIIEHPHKSIEGLWVDLDINITDEDIREARQERWGNFPRNIECRFNCPIYPS